MRVGLSVLLGAALLSACAAPPLGPLVQVYPGQGKSFDQFQYDDAQCRSFANYQVSGQAAAVDQTAVGGALLSTALGAGLGAIVGGGRGAAVGAVTGAGLGVGLGAVGSGNAQGGIQYQYDNAYAQCMYAHGNQVPGLAPALAPPGYAAYPAPPVYPQDDRAALVAAVQGELDRLGYLGAPPDGIAGPQTVSAIQSFEAANGLPIDGAATPFLLDRLRSIRTR